MLIPSGPRLLISRIMEKQMSSSLIEVVEFQKTPSQFGVVLAIGKLKDPQVDVGDIVVLNAYAGAPVTVDVLGHEEEAFIVMEDDVLAVVEEQN